MAFSTTSYLAGGGSVVVILSTGFAGGYMLANPTHRDPPNRLQRLAAENQDTRPVASATPTTKPEAVAMSTPASTPAPATPQPAVAEPPAQSASAPVAAKAPEPVRSSAAQVNAERTNTERAGAEKARIAEARAAERKRAQARKFAERQRKRRELEVATVAVRQMMHDRGGEEFAAMDRSEPSPPEMPPLSLFGQ
jgi:type IV secretory pathway VirB10-like protein